MAPRRPKATNKDALEPSDPQLDTIEDNDVVEEMESSFLDYAMSVIVARALPDVRDGLKPVHRRILYGMYDEGLRPEKSYSKCAKVVGAVMGRMHPHGDQAIYDSLVRMAQDFALRLPLVDGHGNFGSPDDPPAASRYCVTGQTRVRLADGTTQPIADLADIPESTTADADFSVLNRYGHPAHVSKVFNSGTHPVKRITTTTGHSLSGSHNHLVLKLVPDELHGACQRWTRLDALSPGDVVALAGQSLHQAARSIAVSDEDWLAGTLAAAILTSSSPSGPRMVRFSTTNEMLLEKVRYALDSLSTAPSYRPVTASHNRRLPGSSGVKFNDLEIDLSSVPDNSFWATTNWSDSAIPKSVWASSPALKAAFVATLFTTIGGIGLRRITTQRCYHITTDSHPLLADVQELLLDFGVVAQINYSHSNRLLITDQRSLTALDHLLIRNALNTSDLPQSHSLIGATAAYSLEADSLPDPATSMAAPEIALPTPTTNQATSQAPLLGSANQEPLERDLVRDLLQGITAQEHGASTTNYQPSTAKNAIAESAATALLEACTPYLHAAVAAATVPRYGQGHAADITEELLVPATSALLMAARSFDTTGHQPFTAYAAKAVNLAIERALDDHDQHHVTLASTVLNNGSDFQIGTSADISCLAYQFSTTRFVTIAKIEELPPAPVYSLRVDSNDHSFQAGGFVNHNTECRLTPGSMSMVESLDEDTVDWTLTYDASEKEPTVLPSGLPNLLVNGSSGIAVGMATNMVPHNLGEVISGLKALLVEPELSLDKLMEHIPGPDFPTGGILLGTLGVKEAYQTGKGTLTLRARATVEEGSGKRRAIVVTELPYNVGTESIVESIRKMVNAKRIVGISDVKDLSDRRQGLRLVIECKSGFDPAAILNQLYKLTPLQVNVAVQNVALVKGQPRTLSLIQLCQHFLDHRLDVIRRRTQFRLRKAEARAHLVSGLIKAVNAIDDVVRIIRGSKDTASAKESLKAQLDLDEIQALEVLEMPLRRLTSLEVTKLTDELANLRREITSLKELLSSETKLKDQVAVELDQVADSYGNPRRTTLAEPPDPSSEKAVVSTGPDVTPTPCVVTLSIGGVLGRAPQGYTQKKFTRQDILSACLNTNTADHLAAFTNTGRIIRVPVATLPEMIPPSRGGDAPELIGLDKNEILVALCPIGRNTVYALITAAGTIKRIKASAIPAKENTEVIALQADDKLVGVVGLPTEDAGELVIVTAKAQLLRLPATAVRPQGMQAAGMAGMHLSAEDKVLYMGQMPTTPGAVLTTLSDAGRVKVTLSQEYPPKGRGTQGVRCQTFRKGEANLTAAWLSDTQPLALTKSGSAIRLDEPLTRRDGSSAEHVNGPLVGLGDPPLPTEPILSD